MQEVQECERCKGVQGVQELQRVQEVKGGVRGVRGERSASHLVKLSLPNIVGKVEYLSDACLIIWLANKVYLDAF